MCLDSGKLASFFIISKKRPILTLTLVLVILASLALESVGFAMILPVIDAVMVVQSNSPLAFSIAEVYTMLGIEPSLYIVLAAFVGAMLLKNVLAVIRESLREYYAHSYKRDVILGMSHSMLTMDYELYMRERQAY